MLSKSRAPGTVPHRLHVYGSFRQVHGVSGHVTLHFEFQLHILEVRHSLSSLYYILLHTIIVPPHKVGGMKWLAMNVCHLCRNGRSGCEATMYVNSNVLCLIVHVHCLILLTCALPHFQAEWGNAHLHVCTNPDVYILVDHSVGYTLKYLFLLCALIKHLVESGRERESESIVANIQCARQPQLHHGCKLIMVY